ncbi:phosphatase PAP2 family protein [Sporosarcina sp. Te-1]|uniref:phosphatase PAP2 family protein n=1 Tax=Sporosarcina sp. Te-1 TaxID=2818390 RepID=UPI001A9DBA45|nr:phosphatase PAP2 family protein [Sporosarcina sp. Te-1]QTD39966.1 phosphatase PAP2 family protein [Sporosarcina sp. Te-1]
MKVLFTRMTAAFVLCLLFGGIFAVIARGISKATIFRFDETVVEFVQGWENDWLTPIMKAFTWIGSTSVVLCLIAAGTVLLYFILKERRLAYLFLTVMLGTGILNQVLKFIFKRERPDIHRLIEIGGYSFPSGHTMMSFSLYAILAYIVWRHTKTAVSRFGLLLFSILMALMIAISRIYLGVHYPSDVAGGMAASAFWLVVSISVYGYYQNRTSKQSKPSTT